MVPSGVDKDKVNLQLERLDDLNRQLEEARERLEQFPNDRLLISGAERLFQMTAEECINIGQHIIAGLNLEKADSYREIFSILARAEIISSETGQTMARLASFRNRLVHLYWQVDHDEMMDWLKEAGITLRYASEVFTHLKDKGLL